ncbi:hypothetical protein GCM10010406_14430 [Streptomyces thermolineatus]|uniref:Uncharacterized protein n=1 Tax=Streptomyces thermolineatus TaxID=44033 RepID=A0ABN3LBT6_9ACTN
MPDGAQGQLRPRGDLADLHVHVVHARVPGPSVVAGRVPRDPTDLYPNVRVELLAARAARPPRHCRSGADGAPGEDPILAGESVREPMTPIAAACPP